MIQPVAAGKLFSLYNSYSSPDISSQEQEAIAQLDTKRKAMLDVQGKIQRLKDDTKRFGESQGDVTPLQDQLRAARDEYNTARSNLADIRTQKRATPDDRQKRPALVNNYLERRVFARDFPAEARKLKSYQVYNQKGKLEVLSFSSVQFLGSIVDAQA